MQVTAIHSPPRWHPECCDSGSAEMEISALRDESSGKDALIAALKRKVLNLQAAIPNQDTQELITHLQAQVGGVGWVRWGLQEWEENAGDVFVPGCGLLVGVAVRLREWEENAGDVFVPGCGLLAGLAHSFSPTTSLFCSLISSLWARRMRVTSTKSTKWKPFSTTTASFGLATTSMRGVRTGR